MVRARSWFQSSRYRMRRAASPWRLRCTLHDALLASTWLNLLEAQGSLRCNRFPCTRPSSVIIPCRRFVPPRPGYPSIDRLLTPNHVLVRANRAATLRPATMGRQNHRFANDAESNFDASSCSRHRDALAASLILTNGGGPEAAGGSWLRRRLSSAGP